MAKVVTSPRRTTAHRTQMHGEFINKMWRGVARLASPAPETTGRVRAHRSYSPRAHDEGQATQGGNGAGTLLLRQPSVRGAGALHRRRHWRRLKQHLGKTKLIFGDQADDVRFLDCLACRLLSGINNEIAHTLDNVRRHGHCAYARQFREPSVRFEVRREPVGPAKRPPFGPDPVRCPWMT
jgi:hypothetical protein